MVEIDVPEQLESHVRLVKLTRNTKDACETGWPKDRNYSISDPEIIRHTERGGNYGIFPVHNLVVIDCDTDELYNAIPDEWKRTLTVKSGKENGSGRHLYFNCADPQPTKILLKIEGKPIGDIRGTGSVTYTVGAGSIHPDSKKMYEYIDRLAQLVSIKWADISDLRTRFGVNDNVGIETIKTNIPKCIGSSGSLSDVLNLKIEDFCQPVGKTIRRQNGDIQGTHPIHGSDGGKNFSINPGRNVWFCFRCGVGGDPVSWIAYAYCGVHEHRCNRLSAYEFQGVKEWLKNNGYYEKIQEIDDAYHNKKEEAAAAVDLTKILTQTDETEGENEIALARSRNRLPQFEEMPPGIFSEYINFGERVSYSLKEFHFAAFLAVASMPLGRRVTIRVGMTTIYPNIYSMVIGHTTISGKSTACNIAVNEVGPIIFYEEPIAIFNSVRELIGTISDPALVQKLNDCYNALWYYDDCAGFFEDATTWNANIMRTLCQAYDGGKVERTLSKRNKGEYTWRCPEPFLSILFNTTIADIEKLSSEKLFSSGFFPRLMWFIGQGGYPRRNENATDENMRILEGIKEKVKHVKDALQKLPPDSVVFGVCDLIEDWKIESTLSHLEKEDEAFRAAVSRGFIHAYKMAAIFTLYDPEYTESCITSRERLEIPEKHARAALKIVSEYLIPRAMYVYNMCTSANVNNHRVIVLRALSASGGSIERTKLLRKTHLDKKELSSAISTLLESGEIKTRSIKKKGNDKSTEFIIKNS
jgi:hypothetical protein